jgi:hypothetical protein
MNKKQILDTAWVVLLLAFTGFTTALWVKMATPASGLALWFRVAVAVFVSDGAVLFWQYQTRTLKSDSQRKYAGWMLAGAVTLTGILGLLYVAFSLFTLADWAIYTEAVALGVLAVWVTLNVAAHMIISWLDPDTRLTVDKSSTDGATQTERNAAYREAMNVLRPLFAKTQSLQAVREYAEAAGHSPAEVDAIVGEAAAALDRHYGSHAIGQQPFANLQNVTPPTTPPGAMAEGAVQFPFAKNGHNKRERVKVTPSAQ